MNFQQCRYVQTIAETGSFSKAAKKLFLTQPNLSASIRDLEEELGVLLFERSNTGAKLTDDGHDFLKYAKRILGELDLLEGRYRKSFKKFLGRQHPLAKKKSLNLKYLEGYPQVRFRQESSGIHFDEDPLEVLPDQQVIYSNDRGSVMNLLCASDSYASGLGIVNSFIKDQIVLIPLKDSPKHTLGIVTNNKQKKSAIIQAFIEEIQDSLLPHH